MRPRIPTVARAAALSILLLLAWLGGRPAPETARPAARGPFVPSSARAARVIPATPAIPSIRQAAAAGLPLRLSLEGLPPMTLLTRPRKLLADGFALRLGRDGPSLNARPAVFEGRAFTEQGMMGRVSLAFVGDEFSGQLTPLDGPGLSFHSDPETGQVIGQREPRWETRCEIDSAAKVAVTKGQAESPEPAPRMLGQLTAASVGGGADPLTGLYDKFVDPIPRGETYELSLKQLLALVVVDKSATGSDSPAALASHSSKLLAMMTNVAVCYENQLGIRLLLQEIIITPTNGTYEDLPVGSSDNDTLIRFRSWLDVARNRSLHHWDVAIKIGAGLGPGVWGFASVGAVATSNGVGVTRPSTPWYTIAHEIAHVLGSEHSVGGIMNSSALESRDFFTAVESRSFQTAASQIHEHSRHELLGASLMRDPEEMPFANDDARVTPLNRAVRFDPRENDLERVYLGQANAALSVEEVSVVVPPGAGEARVIGNEILFQPARDYAGPAWFSYTLRGSLGNGGAGWLHKAEVGVLVGESPGRAYDFTLTPGQSFSFHPVGGVSGLTQPGHARADASDDDPGLLLLRVNSDAQGEDSFRAGGNLYHLHYALQPSQANQDRYLHNAGLGELRFFPLQNDWGPGYRWLHPGTVTLGGGASPTELKSIAAAQRLIDAVNLSPSKGVLTVVTAKITEGGRPVARPTGELRFLPHPNIEGEARVLYTFEDANGQRQTGTSIIHLAGGAETLVFADNECLFLIPTAADGELPWRKTDFSDSFWRRGKLGLGFDIAEEDSYRPFIGADLQQTMLDQSRSVFIRVPFQVEEPGQFGSLLLRLRYDDGFVAYLNGREVAKANAPTPLSWSSGAVESNEAEAPETFDISGALDALAPGFNVLAIQGLNRQLNSGDFLIQPELIGLRQTRVAEIARPNAPSIRVRQGVGVLFEPRFAAGLPPPFEGPITVWWQVIAAPEGGSVDQLDEGPNAAITFRSLGLHRVRLRAEQNGVRSSDEVEVQVVNEASASSFARTGDDQTIGGLETSLDGQVVLSPRALDGASAWSQISGPGQATFAEARSPQSKVRFSEAGTYRLRLAVQEPLFTVFDDVVIRARVKVETLVGPESRGRYLAPTNDALDATWRALDFDDRGWTEGKNGYGFDLNNDLAKAIGSDVRDLMLTKATSLYVRHEFTLADPALVERLRFRISHDDGFLAYLNGQEIARSNAPNHGVGWNSLAPRNLTALGKHEVDLANFLTHLRKGKNVLAVHGLNSRLANGDFLIAPSLEAAIREAPPAKLTPFQTWLAAYPALPVEARGEERDPDGDTLTNLAEYLFGGDPTKPDLAGVAPRLTSKGSQLALTFRRRTVAGGAAYTLEVSSTLTPGEWKEVEPANAEARPDGDGLEFVTVPLAVEPKAQFFRVRARLPGQG